MDTVWYFAYGGNMSPRVLARRGLEPRSSEAARLDGYRLTFSQKGLLPLEPAFANLEADPAGTVHGVAHRLTVDDLRRLDRYEGAEYQHLEITAVARDAGPVRARAYCNPRPVAGLRPSRRYLRAVCEGARAFGLPEAYVRELEAHPSFHLPLLSDAATLLVGVVERLRYAGLRPERLRMAWKARARR